MRFVSWAFCVAIFLGGLAFPFALYIRGGEFVSIPHLVLFCYLPIAGATLALIALLKGSTARQLFFAHGLAVLAAVYGAEIYLSLKKYVFVAEMPEAPQIQNVPAGIRAYPQLCGEHLGLANPPIRLGDRPVQPVSGLTNNLLNPSAEASAWRFSDQYGFNNPPDQWHEGSLMVVGDSYAFGADAPIGQSFVDRLRQRIGKIVNLGCNGNGPLLELASLVEYAPIVHPQLAIWAFAEATDLRHDLAEELTSPILRQYLSEGFNQDLAVNEKSLDGAIANYLKGCLRGTSMWHCPIASDEGPLSAVLSTGVLTLNELRTALGLGHRLDPRQVRIFEQVLRRAKAVMSAWNGRLVFVYLPERSRYSTTVGQWDAGPYAQQVIDVANGLGIEVIDIDTVFRKHADPAALNTMRHYSTEGYALIGDAIADSVMRLQLK